MALRIGIDSSDSKLRSCCLLGFDTEINKIYSKVNRLLVSHNERGVFHWSKLTGKTRRTTAPKILKILSSVSLRILIFEHKKPRGVPKRKFYLDTVPNEISQELEKHLRRKKLHVIIECDDDYGVKGVKEGTRAFVNKLLENISFRLSGQMTKVLKRGYYSKVELKQHPDKFTTIFGSVKRSGGSKAIQLSDIALGYTNNYQKIEQRTNS